MARSVLAFPVRDMYDRPSFYIIDGSDTASAVEQRPLVYSTDCVYDIKIRKNNMQHLSFSYVVRVSVPPSSHASHSVLLSWLMKVDTRSGCLTAGTGPTWRFGLTGRLRACTA